MFILVLWATECCLEIQVANESHGLLFGIQSMRFFRLMSLERQVALTNHTQWQQWSEQARLRAATLTWDNCAQAFRKIPELVVKREARSALPTDNDIFDPRLPAN